MIVLSFRSLPDHGYRMPRFRLRSGNAALYLNYNTFKPSFPPFSSRTFLKRVNIPKGSRFFRKTLIFLTSGRDTATVCRKIINIRTKISSGAVGFSVSLCYNRIEHFQEAKSLPELPPEDIVADVSPWKKAMNRTLTGLALCTVTLNFWCLNYILPAIGMVLSLLGFRTLQQENRWLRACFILTAIRAAYFFPLLILNTTLGLLTKPTCRRKLLFSRKSHLHL